MPRKKTTGTIEFNVERKQKTSELYQSTFELDPPTSTATDAYVRVKSAHCLNSWYKLQNGGPEIHIRELSCDLEEGAIHLTSGNGKQTTLQILKP
jgi:hypothetical protein